MPLLYVLYQTTSHPVLEVREASFVAIGTAMKVIGEKPLMPFIADVDSIKMAKVGPGLWGRALLKRSPRCRYFVSVVYELVLWTMVCGCRMLMPVIRRRQNCSCINNVEILHIFPLHSS